jgi:hypothetical protein
MSFCTKCGKQNSDTAKFCIGCGTTLMASVILVKPDTTIPDSGYSVMPRPSSIRKIKWIIIGIIVLLGLGAGAYFIFFNKKKENSESLYYTSKTEDLSNNKPQSATIKLFSGKVGKLDAVYSLQWYPDGAISGTYYYPKRPSTSYTLTGKDLGNGNIQLIEYTGNDVSAHFYLYLRGSCYVGQINNTDGRIFNISMCPK